MILYRSNGQPVDPRTATKLGSGAAGIVYGPADDPTICYKLYLWPSADLDRRYRGLRQLAGYLPSDPSGLARLAWPLDDLRDESGTLRGIVLPRAGGTTLHALFTVTRRTESLAEPTWATNVEVAGRIADVFDRVHWAGIVIGDVSPGNLLVDPAGAVTLIDCDSCQFTDPSTGERFAALNTTPEYSSPESMRSGRITAAHDLFGLAILVWQLLHEGDHPYEGVPASGRDAGAGGNIATAACRPFFPEKLRPLATPEPDLLLSPELYALAHRTFVDGHTSPARRASAAEWRTALRQLDLSLTGCRSNPYHFHPAQYPTCPWCRRRAAGLGEHYPDGRFRPVRS